MLFSLIITFLLCGFCHISVRCICISSSSDKIGFFRTQQKCCSDRPLLQACLNLWYMHCVRVEAIRHVISQVFAIKLIRGEIESGKGKPSSLNNHHRRPRTINRHYNPLRQYHRNQISLATIVSARGYESHGPGLPDATGGSADAFRLPSEATTCYR